MFVAIASFILTALLALITFILSKPEMKTVLDKFLRLCTLIFIVALLALSVWQGFDANAEEEQKKIDSKNFENRITQGIDSGLNIVAVALRQQGINLDSLKFANEKSFAAQVNSFTSISGAIEKLRNDSNKKQTVLVGELKIPVVDIEPIYGIKFNRRDSSDWVFKIAFASRNAVAYKVNIKVFLAVRTVLAGYANVKSTRNDFFVDGGSNFAEYVKYEQENIVEIPGKDSIAEFYVLAYMQWNDIQNNVYKDTSLKAWSFKDRHMRLVSNAEFGVLKRYFLIH